MFNRSKYKFILSGIKYINYGLNDLNLLLTWTTPQMYEYSSSILKTSLVKV